MYIVKRNKYRTNFSEYDIIEMYDDNLDKIIGIYSNNSFQSISYCGEKRYELFSDYSKLFDIIVSQDKIITNTLMLGGGGFSYPKYYIHKYLNRKMDVVEIDKDIIDLSYKYFYLDKLSKTESKRLKIYNLDAFDYIKNCNKKYDLVFVDLFKDDDIIMDTFELNNIKIIYNMLINNKYLIINFIQKDNKSFEKLKTCYTSINKMFRNIYMLTLSNIDFNKGFNILIICSDKDIIFEENHLYKVFNYLNFI